MPKPTQPVIPDAPLRSQPATFSARAEAFLAFFPEFATYLDLIADFVDEEAENATAAALLNGLPGLAGNAGLFTRVNTTEDGVEFADPLPAGTRELIDVLDFATHSFSGLDYTWPLFDPTRYRDYEWDICNVLLSTTGTFGQMEWSADSGVTYVNSDTVTELQRSDGQAPGTYFGSNMYSGNSTNGSAEYFNGSIRMFNPTEAAYTYAEFYIRRSAGAGVNQLDVSEGFMMRTLAEAVQGVRFDRVAGPTAGQIRMYGIRA